MTALVRYKLKSHKNTGQALAIDHNLRQPFDREAVVTKVTVKYIKVEKVYFLKDMKGMVTRNWRQKLYMSLYKVAK